MLEIVETPILTRREREKIQLRQAILDATQAIAAKEGWQAVTTRKVAEKIEYSLPTLYEYFENKAALLAELNREGYRQLLAVLQQARKNAPTPTRAMLDGAQAYCNFAWQHRELYEVMHGLSGVVLETNSYHTEAQALTNEAQTALEDWARAEGIQVQNASALNDAVQILRALLHGLASLALAKQIIGGKKVAAALALRAIEDQLEAWRTKKSL